MVSDYLLQILLYYIIIVSNNSISIGVKFVRMGEVIELKDEENVVLNNPAKFDRRKSGHTGTKRKLKLHLDPTQYYEDMKVNLFLFELYFELLVFLEWY